MNEIVSKVLLAGDKVMPEMHLRQPAALGKSGFKYSACGLFTKNKGKTQKFKETGDSQYVYQKELHKVCFQHDMPSEDFKDLPRRTASDKVLPNKVFDIVNNPKYGRYQRGLASIVYKFF